MTRIFPLFLLLACDPTGSVGAVECAGLTRSQVATVAQVDALQDQLDALTNAFVALTDAMPPCVVDPTLDCVSDRQLAAEVVKLQTEARMLKMRHSDREGRPDCRALWRR